jgi:hypothetical protein
VVITFPQTDPEKALENKTPKLFFNDAITPYGAVRPCYLSECQKEET